MKLKLFLLSVTLVILCNTGLAQTFEKNKETGEYYSQKPGEQYYFLEDWNEDSHLLTKKFNTMDAGTVEMGFAQQWMDKHYVVMKYDENDWGTAAIRKFGIDNTKNSTVSLDVEILKSDKSYSSFCGLIFGRGVGSSYYEKYVFVVGKAAGSDEFRYKIMHEVEEGDKIKFDILTEGEISEWQGEDDNINTLTVKCEGNVFNFLINKKLLTTLTINKTEINTNYSGLWLRGKNLKAAFDNLEITGVNKYTSTKNDVPDIIVTPPTPKPTKTTVNCPQFYNSKPVAKAQCNIFLNSVIKDVDNKFVNFREEKFPGQKRRTDVLSEAITRIGNSISFDIDEYANLDEAMKEANNIIYNAPLGKNSCWQLDTKLCSKDAYNYQNVYLITNTNNEKVKVRIWVLKYNANTVNLQITVSDK